MVVGSWTGQPGQPDRTGQPPATIATCGAGQQTTMPQKATTNPSRFDILPDMQDFVMNLRHRLIRLAETISRKTYFLDKLKTRLGISQLVLKILAPPVSKSDRTKIMTSLDLDYIARKTKQVTQLGNTPTYWILLTHSMGDIVACEPIARYLKQMAPAAKIGWIVRRPFRELVAHNPNIDSVATVESLAEGKSMAAKLVAESPDVIIVDCHFDGTSCPATNKIFRNPANPRINIHTYYSIGPLLETYSLAAGLPPLTDSPIFYFGGNHNLPDGIHARRIVFHCRSSEQCRDWTDEKWNLLADKLAETGYQVVEVGTERVLDCGKNTVFDFTGSQNLIQIASIIKDANAFVGVDSVFAHIANAVMTPSVILLGKYRNFPSYFPYTGTFSHSDSFQVVRAINGQPASNIEAGEVLSALQKLLTKPAPTI